MRRFEKTRRPLTKYRKGIWGSQWGLFREVVEYLYWQNADRLWLVLEAGELAANPRLDPKHPTPEQSPHFAQEIQEAFLRLNMGGSAEENRRLKRVVERWQEGVCPTCGKRLLDECHMGEIKQWTPPKPRSPHRKRTPVPRPAGRWTSRWREPSATGYERKFPQKKEEPKEEGPSNT